MRLLDDVVWIAVAPPTEKIGMIHVPVVAQETTDWEHTPVHRGTVLFTGPGLRTKHGRKPMHVAPGDTVVIDQDQMEFVNYDGQELVVTREPEILALEQ